MQWIRGQRAEKSTQYTARVKTDRLEQHLRHKHFRIGSWIFFILALITFSKAFYINDDTIHEKGRR